MVSPSGGFQLFSNSLTSSMLCFDSLIRELELCDPPLLNAKFTWSNVKAFSICCRLDRFLFSRGWLDFFPCYRQTVSRRITSDYFALILYTKNGIWGPTPFRFENVWLEHKNLRKKFANWWNGKDFQGWEGYKFMRKLKVIKTNLKKWNEVVLEI